MNGKKSSLFFLFGALIAGILYFLFCPRWKSGDGGPVVQWRPQRRNGIVKAIEKTMPSVVNIGTERIVRSHSSSREGTPESFERLFDNFLRRQQSAKSYSLGSGFIIDPSGLIVTNAHVVERAARIVITLYGGENCEAYMLADDPLNDIALLQLKEPPPGLKAIDCDSSGRLYLGETVIAVGNPFGLDSSVTAGTLSGTKRRFMLEGRIVFSDIIQMDALVYPGNSGGPLINIAGEVIGMNMSVYENAPGIGFAIPLSRIENVLAKWLIPERFAPVSLGIVPGWSTTKTGIREVIVADVLPGSPAAHAGVKRGARIISANGRRVWNLLVFSRQLIRFRCGENVTLATDEGTFRLAVARMKWSDPFRAAREKLSLQLIPTTAFLADELGYPVHSGLLVSDLLPDTPPEIRRGELLIKLGPRVINSARDLAAALKDLHYHDTVQAVFLTTVHYRGKEYLAKRRALLPVR